MDARRVAAVRFGVSDLACPVAGCTKVYANRRSTARHVRDFSQRDNNHILWLDTLVQRLGPRLDALVALNNGKNSDGDDTDAVQQSSVTTGTDSGDQATAAQESGLVLPLFDRDAALVEFLEGMQLQQLHLGDSQLDMSIWIRTTVVPIVFPTNDMYFGVAQPLDSDTYEEFDVVGESDTSTLIS